MPAFRDRHAVIDPECPHGGPYLSDEMMEWTYKLAAKIERLSRRPAITCGESHPGSGKTYDLSFKAMGAFRAYIACMINYIRECEAEIERLKAIAPPTALLANPTMADLVEHAISQLPAGWELRIAMYRGESTVLLFDPEGRRRDPLPQLEATIPWEVDACLKLARDIVAEGA